MHRRGAQAVLKCVIAVLLLAVLLSGCGPSQAERRAAWLQAFQMDLDITHDKWEADVARKWFRNKLKADIALGRQALTQNANQTQRDAAMLQWWEAFWSQQRETYQATPSTPIDCRVISDEARGRLVQCE